MFSSISSTTASILPPKVVTPGSIVSTLVVIDAGVADYQQLIAGVADDAAVLLLGDRQDGVAQISSALKQLPGITQLHIIAHGAPGTLYLGNGELSLSNIDQHSAVLAGWFAGSGAELLIYGCNVAAGDAGEEFLAKLEAITQVKIAASTTKIGNFAQGGNWSLDATTVDFQPQLAVSAAVQSSYAGTFNWFQAERLLADATVKDNGDLSSTSQGDLDNFDEFGSAVAIYDGFAVVGVPENTDVVDPNTGNIVPGSDVGSVYIFTIDPNTGAWSRETQLVANDPFVNANFGAAVDATSIDGELYVAIGAPQAQTQEVGAPTGETEASGAVYIFKRTAAGVWSQVQKIEPEATQPINGTSSRAGDFFGASVGIDGTTVVVGSPRDNPGAGALSGSISIFQSADNGASWGQLGNAIANPNQNPNATGDEFGTSVAIADGLIIAGAPGAEVPGSTGQLVTGGAAYIFNANDGSLQASLVGNDIQSSLGRQGAENGDRFGESVDIVNGYAIVGARGNDIVLGDVGNQQVFSNAGAAYIFAGQGTNWTQLQMLTGTEGPLRAGDQFGNSVAIDDGIAIVGSITEDVDFNDPTTFAPSSTPGAAFVYEFNGTSGAWEETQRLISDNTADDPRMSGDSFGAAVDVYTSDQGSSSVIIGANTTNFIRGANDLPNNSQSGTSADIFNSGSAYIFRSQPQVVGLQVSVVTPSGALSGLPALPSGPFIADLQTNSAPRKLEVRVLYDQPMNQGIKPTVNIQDFVDPAAVGLAGSLAYSPNESNWESPNSFVAVYDMGDANVDIDGLDFRVDGAQGVNGASQLVAEPAALDFLRDVFSIDTDNPELAFFRSFSDAGFDLQSAAPTYTNQSFWVAGSFDQQIFKPDPSFALPTAPVDASVITPLANGAIADFNFDGGGTFSFRVDLAGATEGNVTVELPVGAVADEATNLSFQSGSISAIYDITPPTVALALGTGQADPTNAPFDVFINVADNLSPIENLTESDVVVTSANATVVANSFVQINPNQYKVTIDPTISLGLQGPIVTEIAAGAFNDLAGNVNAQASNVSIFYDGIRPTVTITPPTTTNPGVVTGPFSIVVSFSELVTDFTTDDLVVTNATLGGAIDNGDGTYSIGYIPVSAGDVTISIGENVAFDAATNGNTASNTITLDYQPPSPELTSIVPSVPVLSDVNAGGAFTLTATFNKDMDQSAGSLPLFQFPTANEDPTSPAGSPTISPTTGIWIDARTFEQTFTVQDSNLFIPEIDVQVTNAVDTTGNGLLASTGQVNDVFGVDMVNPTVTLTPSGSVITGYTIDAVFSESVLDFTTADVIITNGTLVANSFTGSGANYSFSVTPIDPALDVEVTVSNGAIDINQNENIPETLTLAPTVDVNDPPVITLSSNSAEINGDRALVFSSATGTQISVSDPDASTVQVSLSASSGVLSLAGQGNGLVSFSTGDGFADSSIVFTGTLADVNSALEGLIYKPVNFDQTATLTFTVDDLGNTGAGGAQTDTEILTVDVTRATPKDFNFDGFSDLLWRNSASGTNLFWGMVDQTFVGTAPITQQTDTNWEIVGATDFNRDDSPDILWRNRTTGENFIWFLNGGNLIGGVPLPGVSDPSWNITGTGDFNADGEADIIWRNSTTGSNVVWFMDGPTAVSSTGITSVPDLNWEMSGATDLSGDGQADIIWRNTVTGQNAIWIMDGPSFVSGANLPTVLDQNWNIVGTGDYNSDGFDDLIWQNSSTGNNIAWLMNGTSLAGAVNLPGVGDTTWSIVQN